MRAAAESDCQLTVDKWHAAAVLRHRITELREAKGVSKAHLARRLGVCAAHMTLLEQGKRAPSGELMLRMAQYFKCSVEAIFQIAPDRTQTEPLQHPFPGGSGQAAGADSASVSVHPTGPAAPGLIVVSTHGDGRGAPVREPKPNTKQ